MERDYLTVSSLNNYIKSVLERDSSLSNILLKGEISNLKKHTTGHWYFTLKDETSRINAVMFSRDASTVDFNAEDGMNILIEGRVSAYPVAGTYQIYVTKMQLDGVGNLHIEFEKLKKKLAAEGLFSTSAKKEIPKYPEVVGVITAPTGAAVKDIMSTINRRFPSTKVVLFPALVQGEGAAPSVVKQIKEADSYGVDVIIVGRGGGSIEDLWAFNEEIVARAIYECVTPIISAVGHEIDVTISDYVADLRAPTPTGAAEMAVPTVVDTTSVIDGFKIRLNKNIKNMVNTKFIELRTLKESYILKNPMSMYEIKMQKLDTLIDNSNRSILSLIETKKYNIDKLNESYILKNPDMILDTFKNKMEMILVNLKNLNPLGILEKGFSVVETDKKVVKSSKDLKVGEVVNMRFNKGTAKAEIKEIK